MEGDSLPADRALTALRAGYNRIARFYDLLEILDERTYRSWRRKLLARAEGRVLEVGIGTGKNFPYYPPGVVITGIDVAENMLAAARKRADGCGIEVDFLQADVQELPFPDDVFDSAVSTFVFCSVPDPVRGLREVRRVLRPEGQFLLLEHMHDGRTEAGVLMRFLSRLAGGPLQHEIRNRMSLARVRQAGLLIERVDCLQKEEKVEGIVARPGKPRPGRARVDVVTA
jgi:ubiquinone/menaquinone biosynthesis C-methylase UbiE